MWIKAKYEKVSVISIYILMSILFICKVNFYDNNVGRFPDEQAQVSYIAYLEKTGEVIPKFEKMTILVPITYNEYRFSDTAINYLGHPPLYYHLMRLSGGVKDLNGIVIVNLDILRRFSQLIAYLGIALSFYLGLKMLDHLSLHLLYSGIIISIPMLAYMTASVNNDTLAFLGVNITVLGFVRYKEDKKNFLTYLIIAIGMLITTMSKLTAGMIIIQAFILFAMHEFIKEKSLKFILNKNMLLSLPIYVFILIYFMYILNKYHTLQPGLKTIAPEYFRTTGFYVDIGKRNLMSFKEYLLFYWKHFLKTWSGIYSHVELLKEGSATDFISIGLNSILILPIFSFITIKKNKLKTTFSFVYIGVLFTLLFQFIFAYNGFISNGYTGGYQSRYYLCALPIMAMLICLWAKDRFEYVKNELESKQINTRWAEVSFLFICVIFVLLLIYEDIIYFIINFINYL